MVAVYLINHVEIAENCKSGRKAHTLLCPGDSLLQSTLSLSARKGWWSGGQFATSVAMAWQLRWLLAVLLLGLGCIWFLFLPRNVKPLCLLALLGIVLAGTFLGCSDPS